MRYLPSLIAALFLFAVPSSLAQDAPSESVPVEPGQTFNGRFQEVTGGGTQDVQRPSRSAEDTLLAFVDVETTGLKPGHHEVVDIGLIYTDLAGNEIGRLYLKIMPDHPERASPEARRINGFNVKRWRRNSALRKEAAVERITDFHREHAGNCLTILVAFNSQFDAAFLDYLFRDVGRRWEDVYHYYVLDIPSMAWQKGTAVLSGSKLASRIGVPDEPGPGPDHTGMTGAELNLRIYRKLQK